MSRYQVPLIKKAMRELVRVAKKRAPIFVSVIGRFGAAQDRLREAPERLLVYKHTLRTGENIPVGFTRAHFFFGRELEELFSRNNLKIIDKVGLEGMSSCFEKETNNLYKNKKLWSMWLDMLKQTANDPATYGASLHFMLIGRKQ
ncbi:hypothetical protein HY489_04540 [Candidatus Woesearchaeota archaeon]|nr:hypothetical protein [Candidatus Woesearchaeota archaeon]